MPVFVQWSCWEALSKDGALYVDAGPHLAIKSRYINDCRFWADIKGRIVLHGFLPNLWVQKWMGKTCHDGLSSACCGYSQGNLHGYNLRLVCRPDQHVGELFTLRDIQEACMQTSKLHEWSPETPVVCGSTSTPKYYIFASKTRGFLMSTHGTPFVYLSFKVSVLARVNGKYPCQGRWRTLFWLWWSLLGRSHCQRSRLQSIERWRPGSIQIKRENA